MTEHPPLAEIEQYARAELRADDLLRVDDHLAACDPCRELAAAVSDITHRADAAVLAVQADLAGVSTNDDGGRVIRMADRSPAARALRWTAYAAVAASAALAATFVLTTRSTTGKPSAPADPAATAAVTVPDPLTAGERQLVDTAIASGTIERPTIIAALRQPSGALMGGPDVGSSPTLTPVRPVAVAVDEDRPTFEWTDAGAGAVYRVAVYDAGYNEVAASGPIRGTQWIATRPLARGKTYTWQVSARVGTTERTAPAPPQPETRFVMTTDTQHAELVALRQRASGSHVALAVLLAKAGVLDEAERELALAAAENPGASSVQRLQTSLAALRQAP